MTVDPEALAPAITDHDRAALARGITLVESTRADHRAHAVRLLDLLAATTGGAVRIGVSGPPGVGKSSLIEALGLHLIDAGHHVAVLAVDPTSPRTGGSVLGDKTRMEELGRSPAAFIRPSPSGTTVGGVARRTRESLLLCEAAGFDPVIIETVGTGQSDVAVAEMVDVFVLLVQPSSGDELQGIKRGVMELADLVLVTKADGDLLAGARQSVADHRSALELLHHHDAPPVLACSAKDGTGIPEAWSAIAEISADQVASGRRDARRREQNRQWLWTEVEAGLVDQFLTSPSIKTMAPQIEDAVADGSLAPPVGAARLLQHAFDPA